MSGRARSGLALALVVLGGAFTFLAAIGAYADHVLVNRNGFADTVAQVVRKPAVSREISLRLSNALVDAAPDAIVAERPIQDAAEVLLSSGKLDPVVRRAALTMHDVTFEGGAEQISLDLEDGVRLLGSFVATQDPALKAQAQAGVHARLLQIRRAGVLGRIAEVAHVLDALAWILPLTALLLLGGAVAVAPDRGRTLRRAGIAVGAAGVGVIVAEYLLVKVIGGMEFAARDAAREALDVFVGGLTAVAIVLIIAGALVAAAGRGMLSAGAGDRAATRAWGYLRARTGSTRVRVFRVVVLLLLGLVMLTDPIGTLRALVAIAGFFVLVEALAELVALLEGPAARGATVAATSRRRVVAVGAGGIALIVLAAFTTITLRPAQSAASLSAACNGSPSLCDRPLDMVALPASHNAQSSADAGFIDPNQRPTIVGQLDAGIRGLLIDSLMAQPTTRHAAGLTVFDGEVLAKARAEVGPDGLAAARSIVGRSVLKPTGPAEPMLCHIACELGATRMVDALTGIRGWLERHPREVIVIVIQDLVTPADTERVFRESGLLGHVYTWHRGDPAPTLRQMIDQHRQVLVMAEEDGIPGSWYPAGYRTLLKETPYDNATVEALDSDASCRPNRGRERDPLFLVNHWVAVYPPLPSKAQVVNSEAFLLRRVRRCQRIRGAFPNLIAVDFQNIGDVVAVADRINGVS